MDVHCAQIFVCFYCKYFYAYAVHAKYFAVICTPK